MERASKKSAHQTGQPLGLWRIRFLGSALSIAVHLMVLAALFWPRPVPERSRVPPSASSAHVIMVRLIEAPRPLGPRGVVEPKDIGRFNPVQPDALHLTAPVVIMAASESRSDTSDVLSESQLAGAASAGAGGGGSGCDIARLVQQALRHDPLVHTAVEEADRVGKAILLWNGDWVQTGKQEGKGLSAVREAIMWEVAFAPVACRNKQENGLVLLSLADGTTRFAIGTANWRWSDLLGVHRVPPAR